jgi:hypothetical protein
MRSGSADYIPSSVCAYLEGRTGALRRRKIKCLRLMPLLLRQPFSELLRRRAGLFRNLTPSQTDFGLGIAFERKLKPTPVDPRGRIVEGAFDALAVSENLSLLASSLDLDAHENGPRLLARKAYPIAKRPFLPSPMLRRLIEQMAAPRQWTAISLDAIGYDRKTRQFRRDMKQQSVSDAMSEMSEQGRQLHRVLISFQEENGREKLRSAFDRYGCATVHKGDIGIATTGFVLPAARDALAAYQTFDVVRTPQPLQQQVVQLTYRDDPFEKREGMTSLCRSVRDGEGLSVTEVHLNPYLQAQILDFFTGAAVEMLVMDSKTVSLIPRSDNCQATLERIAAVVFRHFGEAKVSRVLMASA